MPITRSQTRGGQPPPRVTSPRDGWNRPRRLAASRQGNAVVAGPAEEGSPSTSDTPANGNQQTGPSPSHLKRCRTCPSLLKKSTFVSNVTKKIYSIINLYGTKDDNCRLRKTRRTTIVVF